MVALGRLFDWRGALVIVKPETFIKWHRTAFRVFWRWRSRKRGRPAPPNNIRKLVRQMARENPTWGEERIADELSLKLGIRFTLVGAGRFERRPPAPKASERPKSSCQHSPYSISKAHILNVLWGNRLQAK